MFENEHIVCSPAQLLRNWREQRPSYKGDLDLSVVGETGRVLHAVNLLLASFLYFVIIFGLVLFMVHPVLSV
jgi:hypothetical protein